jgi:hypothetical protein
MSVARPSTGRAAGALSDADPADGGEVGTGAPGRVLARLVEGVGNATTELPPGDLVEVTLATIRQAHSRPWTVGLPDPDFAWKPAFARRSLGLAAVRACAEGRFRGPAAAVAPLADAAVDEWRRSGRRQFHWEPWFSGLGPGGRAVVLAEAVTWATPLWAAFDWSEVGRRAVLGGADDLWTCPGPGTVRLKGRCEVRIGAGGAGPVGSGRSGGPMGSCRASDLVSLSGGSPGDGWREELGYLALVAGLSSSGRAEPNRVTGIWPDTGERRVVTVDEELLVDAADSVVSTVALTCAARSANAGAAVPA